MTVQELDHAEQDQTLPSSQLNQDLGFEDEKRCQTSRFEQF